MQPKLLRFLQSGEVLPIGEPRPFKVDIRLIAATNKDLRQEVDEGRFRTDLFYRISTISINIPPLRRRRAEVPHLINFYLKHYSELSGKDDIVITDETIGILNNYSWPGNIRQLRGEIHRIVLFSESGDLITPDNLSPEIVFSQGGLYLGGGGLMTHIDTLLQDHRFTLSDALGLFEPAFISRALELHSGLISPTARDLGVTRRGFKLKLRKFNITATRRTK